VRRAVVGNLEGTLLSVAGATIRTVANSQSGKYICLVVSRGWVYANRALRLSLRNVNIRVLIFGEAFLWLKRNKFCTVGIFISLNRILPTIDVGNFANTQRASSTRSRRVTIFHVKVTFDIMFNPI
jgi:hypothetical protein